MNSAEIQGFGLSMLNKFASSEWPDKLRVRKPFERLLYTGSKNAFQLAGTLARRFESNGAKLESKERLPPVQKGLFDLNLTEEQEMLRDTLRRFSTEVLRPAAHDADAEAKVPDEVRAQAAELGLSFYAVPESLGGVAAQLSVMTNALAAEELGNGDLSLGAAILAPVGVANALTRWGSKEQQGKYLPAFVGDKPPIATFAVVEAKPAFNPYELATTAKKTDSGYVLDGEKSLVLLAKEAELFLVSAHLGGKPAVFVVEGGAKGITLREEPAMGLKATSTCRVRFEGTPAEKLGDDDFDYQAFLDLGALGFCALAVGTCQAVLDYVVEYANDRKAFGEPISHRQSVAFLIADIAIELDAMRMLVWKAASLAEQGKPFAREAFLARLLVAEKAMKIGNDGVQLLGGHGYCKDHPVERWYRDLRSIAIVHSGLHL